MLRLRRYHILFMEFFRLFSYLKKNLTQRFFFRPGPEIQLANFSPFLRMQDLARALHLTLKCVFDAQI